MAEAAWLHRSKEQERKHGGGAGARRRGSQHGRLPAERLDLGTTRFLVPGSW